jgi:hypothetical protein
MNLSSRSHQTPQPGLVVLSWMIVVLPLAWGIYQSVVKSLPLFQIHRGS